MFDPATCSGQKSASSVIYARSCRLMGFQVNEGTGAATISVYNSSVSTSSGSLLVDKHITSGGGVTENNQWFGPNGIYCNNGIYADISGTNATYIVYFCPM